MRSDNANFSAAWNAQAIRPQYAFRIDFGGADYIYITSSAVTGLTGSNVYDGYLSNKIDGTSQKINPDKSVSSIGQISFEALDIDNDLTAIQRTKLDADKGLRGKQVAFYVGEAGLSWSDFVLATVQVIEKVELDEGKYTFSCRDIQRGMRQDIFEPKTANISASLTADDTTIPVYTTAGFQLVRQPDSPGGVIPSAGAEVGYIKLPTGCIVKYTGVTANSFTGCTWGELGTSALVSDVTKDAGVSGEDAPKIEEFIYREGPAVMIIYELLTGIVYDYQSDTLPDHWHLGIDSSLVKLTDFENIGSDWWDTSNNDLGVAAVIQQPGKTDGKKFIEEQLYTMLGAFSPIYNDGSIGLKRLENVHENGSYVRKIEPQDIVRATAITHDMESVLNRMSIKWNWDHLEERFTRLTLLDDTDSQDKHGLSKPRDYVFRTLASSRHSSSVIVSRFNSLRDRYSGPPIKTKVTLLPRHNDLEVGDIIRLCLPKMQDYTSSNSFLDRNFEIQQTKIDWKTGRVTLDLFGSSQIAAPISGGGSGTVLDDSWYSSEGTEINATNFPGKVTSAAGLTTITGDITLTGNASLNNSSAIYYCDEDLTINAGVIVTRTLNTQLRVKGFFQVNGTMTSAGQGAAGQSGGVPVSAQFIGNPTASRGIFIDDRFSNSQDYILVRSSSPSVITGTANNSAPYLSVSVDNSGNLVGLPISVSGTPGPRGGGISQQEAGVVIPAGGSGGAAGGGMVNICRGADLGASGQIISNGSNGLSGATDLTYTKYGLWFRAGAGGGGYCGAVYWLIDGATNNAPSLSSLNSKAIPGLSPRPSADYVIKTTNTLYTYGGAYGWPESSALAANTLGTAEAAENTYEVNHRIQFLS